MGEKKAERLGMLKEKLWDWQTGRKRDSMLEFHLGDPKGNLLKVHEMEIQRDMTMKDWLMARLKEL